MREIVDITRVWAAVMLLAVAGSLQSCLNDDDDYPYDLLLPDALVTVKPVSDDAFYMQVDDNTRLFPTNMKGSPFGSKEVRALVNYTVENKGVGTPDMDVHVNWIDSLLTKPMAPNLGETENEAVYGSDPVEIINDWVTIVEDGYLTMRFRILSGNKSQKHFVNLISTNNPDDPYEVEFRHNAYGDVTGVPGDGLVAFRLDALPDTEGETVKLTLKWQAFSGEKSAQFDYCTRQTTVSDGSEISAVRNSLNLQ